MSIDTIKKLEADIEQAERDHQAFLRQKEREIDEGAKQRDKIVAALQKKRNDLALQMKLKDYPKKLVMEHKTCSVCGADMRPFKIARGEAVQRLWACAAGNLSVAHDLVTVSSE